MNTLTYDTLTTTILADPTATYTVETARGTFTMTGSDMLRILHPSHIILSVSKEVTP